MQEVLLLCCVALVWDEGGQRAESRGQMSSTITKESCRVSRVVGRIWCVGVFIVLVISFILSSWIGFGLVDVVRPHRIQRPYWTTHTHTSPFTHAADPQPHLPHCHTRYCCCPT